MTRTRDTSAILNLSPSCFQRVQISFFTFKKSNFSPQIHLTQFKKPNFVILILRKSLKPNKKILSYLGSFQVRIRRDRGRRRSSHRQVRSRRAGRRRTVVPRDHSADEKTQHPDVQRSKNFQESKQSSSVKSPQQRLITDWHKTRFDPFAFS